MRCLSSGMNACQALVTTGCGKPKVQKSPGMESAIEEIFNANTDDNMKASPVPLLSQNAIPSHVGKNVNTATMEFAGVKFTGTTVSDLFAT